MTATTDAGAPPVVSTVTLAAAECSCPICALEKRATAFLKELKPPYPWAQPEARFRREMALDLTIVGMRREGSIDSDKFDDRMAAFFRLPSDVADNELLEEWVEGDLLDALASSAASANEGSDFAAGIPTRARIVKCVKGVVAAHYAVALFPVSTDPGYVAYRATYQNQVDALDARIRRDERELEEWKALADEVAELRKKWEGGVKEFLEKRKRSRAAKAPPLADEEIREIEAELKSVQRELEAREARLRAAKELPEPMRKSIQRTKAKLADLHAKLQAVRDVAAKGDGSDKARRREQDARVGAGAALGDAVDAAGGLQADAKKGGEAAAKDRADAEKARQKPSDAMAAFDTGRFAPGHALAQSLFPGGASAVEAGWVGDGRAIFPVGFFPEHFAFALHHGIEKDAVHTALAVNYFRARRTCSTRFLRERTMSFIDFGGDGLPGIGAVRDAAGKETALGAGDWRFEAWATGTDGEHRVFATNGTTWKPLALTDEVLRVNRASPKVEWGFPSWVKKEARWRKVSDMAAAYAMRSFPVQRHIHAGHIRTVAGSTVVLERLDDKTVRVTFEEVGKPPSTPADDDQFDVVSPSGVIGPLIGGTNIHRAHGLEVDESSGALTANSPGTVGVYSVGCQVFPRFEDFNLFILMAALSKRVRCRREGGPAPSHAAAQLEQQAGKTERDRAIAAATVDRKEKAWSARDGEAKKAEEAVAKAKAPVPKKLTDQATKARAAEKEVKTAWDKAKGDFEPKKKEAEDARAAADKAWNDEQATHGRCQRIDAPPPLSETAAGVSDLAAAFPRTILASGLSKQTLWKRARSLMLNWTRRCDLGEDLGGWCKVRFDYTLLELPDAAIDALEDAFKAKDASANDLHRPWSGEMAPEAG